MKTKIFLFLLCLSFFSFRAQAQWAVIDPTNLAQGIINMGQNIQAVSKTTGETLNVFKQTKALYDENKKFYDDLLAIKDFVKETKKVGRSIKMVSDMSDMFIDDFSKFTSDPNLSLDEINTYMGRYNRSIRIATEELKVLSKVIGRGLSMNDKERMDKIDESYDTIYSCYGELQVSRLEIQMLSEHAQTKEKKKRMLKEFSGRKW